MTDAIMFLNSQETSQYLKAIHEPRDQAITLLFLTTGLFLQEVVDLKVGDINWDKRHLTISGKRHREIAINDQAFDALARWSKERVSTSSPAFFLTTKGKVNGLTARAIDALLRKYGKAAGLQKPVNAHLLRNSFAIRFFDEHPDIELKKAGQILGIHDHDSLKRYQLAASQSSPQAQNHHDAEDASAEPQALSDSRPLLSRTLSKLFPVTPKPAKELPTHLKADPEDLLFGRDSLLAELKASLNKGESTLLVSALGMGKTQILRKLAKDYGQHALYVESPSPLKPWILDLMAHLSSEKPNARSSVQDLVDEVLQCKTLSPPILMIDNMHKLRTSDVDLIMKLMDTFTMLGSVHAHLKNPKLKTLWWKFKEVEVQALNDKHSKALIQKLTQHMTISDYEQLENRVLHLANGNPLAIVEMTKQLNFKPVVTRDVVRSLYHEAGVTYRDWSWGFAVIWGVIVICRFIALGTHSFEGYILAGIGTTIFLMIRTLTAKMR